MNALVIGLRGRCPCLSVVSAAQAPARTDIWRTGTAAKITVNRICAGQWHIAASGQAVCKTVGSAYDGSNPSPATRCGNGPLAANSRASGPFLLCPSVCHLVALLTAVSRHPRTHSGRNPGRQDGRRNRGFPRTARTGRAGGVFPLTCARRVERASACARPAACACRKARPPAGLAVSAARAAGQSIRALRAGEPAAPAQACWLSGGAGRILLCRRRGGRVLPWRRSARRGRTRSSARCCAGTQRCS
jgi:hypothetical protein